MAARSAANSSASATRSLPKTWLQLSGWREQVAALQSGRLGKHARTGGRLPLPVGTQRHEPKPSTYLKYAYLRNLSTFYFQNYIRDLHNECRKNPKKIIAMCANWWRHGGEFEIHLHHWLISESCAMAAPFQTSSYPIQNRVLIMRYKSYLFISYLEWLSWGISSPAPAFSSHNRAPNIEGVHVKFHLPTDRAPGAHICFEIIWTKQNEKNNKTSGRVIPAPCFGIAATELSEHEMLGKKLQ